MLSDVNFFLSRNKKKIWQPSSNLQSQPIQRVLEESLICVIIHLYRAVMNTEYPQEHLVWAGSCTVTRTWNLPVKNFWFFKPIKQFTITALRVHKMRPEYPRGNLTEGPQNTSIKGNSMYSGNSLSNLSSPNLTS